VILFNKMQRIYNKKAPVPSYIPPSSERRFRVLSRIHEENKSIVQRIESQKPTINTRRQFRDRRKQEQLLKFICKYPYKPFETRGCTFFLPREAPESAPITSHSKERTHSLKRVQLIGHKRFEISVVHGPAGLRIKVVPSEGDDYFEVDIPPPEARAVLRDCGGSLEQLCTYFEMRNGTV
jgi:hypothetical protein